MKRRNSNIIDSQSNLFSSYLVRSFVLFKELIKGEFKHLNNGFKIDGGYSGLIFANHVFLELVAGVSLHLLVAKDLPLRNNIILQKIKNGFILIFSYAILQISINNEDQGRVLLVLVEEHMSGFVGDDLHLVVDPLPLNLGEFQEDI